MRLTATPMPSDMSFGIDVVAQGIADEIAAPLLDTVVAISTPPGKGGVAVLRLTGPEAFAVADRVVFPAAGVPLSAISPRRMTFGVVRDPADGHAIDDVLAVRFAAPASFTGEDTVEISCHGGVLITRDVLEACLLAGARQALPGEFTRRAFLSGKLDLTAAEALGNLLDAGNEGQVRLARAGMSGLLSDRTEQIYRELCGVLANLEVGMDFPEEDLSEMSRDELLAATEAAARQVDSLLATYRTGHAIAEGIPTVLCGRPNVGKSALYNRLLGRDAAIVTPIAGTTRDVLTDTVTLGGVTLRLSDTAGLHDTADPIEQMGVDRARRALEEAELVLFLSDGTDPAADEALYREIAATAAHACILPVRTKCDLNTDVHVTTPANALPVSSLTGEGMDALEAAVRDAFIDGGLETAENAVVFSARQAAALRGARDALETAMDGLRAGLPYDLVADDMRAALLPLASLSGYEAREDVIHEIFARFCVGK